MVGLEENGHSSPLSWFSPQLLTLLREALTIQCRKGIGCFHFVFVLFPKLEIWLTEAAADVACQAILAVLLLLRVLCYSGRSIPQQCKDGWRPGVDQVRYADYIPIKWYTL